MAEDDSKPETGAVVMSEETAAEPEPAPASVPTGLEPAETAEEDSQSISWIASEFIAHEKSAGWYLSLIITAIAIGGALYLLTRDKVTIMVVSVAAVLLGIYGSHKPRQLEYRLDGSGIQVGPKHFTYDQFRTFSVIPEGAFSSIQLMPLKRFSAPLSIYYPPDNEEKITSLLSGVLPYEEARLDAVDRLVRRVRF